MVKFVVDTTNKLFIAKPGVVSFDVKVDLYSDAKEHWLAGGVAAGFDFPIRTIGGDSVGSGKFAGDLYFLRDGWKLRPQEADHTLLIGGNLFLDEGETGNLLIPTLGDFTVIAIGERSNLVLAVNTAGTIAPTQQEIRDAMALATGATINSGSVDAKLNGIQADTDDIQASLAARLDVPVSSRADKADYTAARAALLDALVLLDAPVSSRTVPGDMMALTPAERDSLSNAVWDLASKIEAGLSPAQAVRLMSAMLLGLVTGGPDQPAFKGAGVPAVRVSMTADANGNRMAVILNP
jgi:hypothetical protein